MNRRQVLALSGALAAANLAGCAGDEPTDTLTPTETPTDSPTDSPTETPTEDHPQGGPTVDNERLRELAAGNAGFAMDLHRHLAETEGGNTFLSPFSISLALAMTYAGAAGESEAAMRETLGFTLGEAVHPAFADLQAELAERETTEDPMGGGSDDDENDGDGDDGDGDDGDGDDGDGDDGDDANEVDAFQLAVANALWGSPDYPFADDYLDLVDEYYGGGFNEADFAADPEGERERINAWVADQTEERIDELLPGGSINASTVLVLTNAIYFMASWYQQFDPENTEQATVTALDGSESTVPMMEQNLRTHYADLPRAQAVELPYVGEEVSAVFILPDEGEFEAYEQDLDAATLFGVFDELGDAEGDLRLPQFEYGFDVELREPLSELGMETEFTPGADFSNMVEGSDGPWIDEVYHDAFVSVDEEGTEAAAATAVVMAESAPAETFDLTFDRPFVFCIRDKPTDALLFLGRVTDIGAAQE